MPLDSEPDSLRADLEAAFDAPETDTTSREVASPEKANSEPEPVAASDDRPRGRDGKFLPKDSAGTPAKEASTTAQPTEASTSSPSKDAPKASTQTSTSADAPPVGWTADAKAEWNSLSPAIKAAVLKREVEISSGGKQWSEEKRRYEEIVAPVRHAASRRGLSEADAIQRLMNAQERLDRNPAEAIQWLANAYGVPLSVTQSNGSPAEVAPQIQFAPMLAPIQERLNAIQQRFDYEDQRQTEMTVQRVNQFANDPSHQHFDAVSDEIMAMLPLLKTSNPHATPEQLLQDAYDRAVWANPMTRAAIEAERVAQADAKQRADRSAAVNKAKLASSSLRGTPPAGNAALEQPDTIRGAILAAMEAR